MSGFLGICKLNPIDILNNAFALYSATQTIAIVKIHMKEETNTLVLPKNCHQDALSIAWIPVDNSMIT